MDNDTLSTVQLVEGDRVAVTHEGKTVKGRVVGFVDTQVGVTFTKQDAQPTLYNRDEVLPLYRYHPSGIAVAPLCMLPVNAKE